MVGQELEFVTLDFQNRCDLHNTVSSLLGHDAHPFDAIRHHTASAPLVRSSVTSCSFKSPQTLPKPLESIVWISRVEILLAGLFSTPSGAIT